jgi:hypothetical protein
MHSILNRLIGWVPHHTKVQLPQQEETTQNNRNFMNNKPRPLENNIYLHVEVEM